MISCASPLTDFKPVVLKGLIFDCDGVMLDSRQANVSYYNVYRAALGLGPMSVEEEDYVHAHAVHDSLRRITPPELAHRIQEVRAGLDYREVLPSLTMEPGLVELLGWCRSVGLRLAVNTNRTTTMHWVIDYFGLRGFFMPVVTAGDVANPKPHPESLNKVLSTWRLPPHEVAFIGDTWVDERTAQAAGVPFWAYKNEGLRADLHVSGFLDLLASLRRRFNRPQTSRPGNWQGK